MAIKKRHYEYRIRDYYASLTLARKEVKTPVGRVDLVIDAQKRIVEIKCYRQWKGALGQVQQYTRFFPGYESWLLLFYASGSKINAALISSSCLNFNVFVEFVEIAPRIF